MALDRFSDRLTWLREVSGVSGRGLHELCGISASYSSVAEKRPNLLPRAEQARALATLFGASVEWLVYGVGRPPSERAIRRAVSRARARATTPRSSAA